MNTRTLRNPWVVIGLVLVPLLIAAAFLAGGWGQRSDLGKVKAAIVNHDQMVTINGQAAPLGRQLSAALTERDDENLTWNLTDAAGAAKGLESGEYAAVVTIPSNFSKAATSYGGEADKAEQATIQVQTSPSAGVADSAVARQIAQLATQELNSMLTQTYLDNVYIGFNQTGEQFTTLSNAANQLASGASQLADGAKQASDGTQQLDQGMKQLGAGASQLSDGTPQLVQGADEIVAAGPQLTAGGTKLAEGGPALASGASGLAAGVKQYTDGAGQFVGGVQQLNVGIQQLNTGLQSSDTSELETQLKQLRTGSQGVAQGTQGIAGGADQLSSGVKTVQTTLQDLAAGSAPPINPVPGAAQVEQGCLAQGQPAALCAQMKDVYLQGFKGGATYGWKAGLGAADQVLTGGGDPTKSLIAGADKLASGASQVADGATQLDGGVAQLQTKLPAGIKAQQAELAAGVQQLATGSQTLATEGQKLTTGGTELSKGASQLASGVEQYTAGVGQYTSGVKTYADGVTQFAGGAKTYATGAAQLADGVVQVSQKTPELASGIGQLSSGASQLADGTKTFADGISQGATKVPSYTEAQRKQLTQVVDSPVQSPESSVVHSGMVPLTLLVLVLATWLGALALHLIVRPVPREVLGSSQPTWRLMANLLLPTFGLATAWAALLSVIGAVAMKTSATTGFGVFAVLELAALTFVVVNHALAAWLPGFGRLLAVVWAAAAAAVGTTAALPGVFGAVHGFGPIKPALDGLRAVVAGTSAVGPVFGLIGWLLVALTLSAIAFARARQLSVKQYQALATAA